MLLFSQYLSKRGLYLFVLRIAYFVSLFDKYYKDRIWRYFSMTKRQVETIVYGRKTVKELNEGSNITLTENNRSVTIASGAMASVAWGSITGTLASQTDLQNALNAKPDLIDLSTVATTGDYNDLLNLPAIPVNLNDLGDVVITTPLNGQVVKYNGINWVNATEAATSWGSITGTLSSQTDLNTALGLKANTAALAPVAFSGLIGDLNNVVFSIPAVGQVLKFNGVNWTNDTDLGASPAWGTISGVLSAQTDLWTELTGKINLVVGPTVGNFPILTGTGSLLNSSFNSTSFATAAQGLLADSAVQPLDNVSTLTNDAGYISGVANLDDIGDVNVGSPGPAQDGYSVVWNNTNSQFELIDVVGSVPLFSGSLVAKSSSQNLPAATPNILVDWPVEAYDTNNYHDNIVDNSRLTVPLGVSWVKLKASIRMNSGTTNSLRSVRFRKNGSTTFVGNTEINRADETGIHDTTIYVETPVLEVVGGDYFEVEVDNGDAGPLLLLASNTTWFSVEAFS